MSDPELNAIWTAEIERTQRQRKSKGLPPLTGEQANRLRTVSSGRQAVQHRMRAGRQHSGFRGLRLGITILGVMLLLCIAGLSRILRR